MLYTIEKIKNMYTKKVIQIIFIIPILIFLAIQNSISTVFDVSPSLKDAYSFTINQSLFFFIPIVCLYFYLIRNIELDFYEKNYFYKFNSKIKLLKSNLISNFIFTAIFVLLINLILVILFSITKYSSIDLEFIKILIISVLLQILVLYIYSLIGLIINCIFVKFNSEVTILFNILILISGVLKDNLDMFGGFSLYKFFTYLNLKVSNTNIILAVSLLIFLIYILINILEKLYKSDFLKYLNTNK